MAGGMTRGAGVSLSERVHRTATDVQQGSSDDREGGRHCWVVDAPGHPGRYPGLLIEWRRRTQTWDGLVAYVLPEPNGEGSRLVERWIDSQYLQRT